MIRNRLKELRKSHGYTLDDIENITGIKRGTYSNYENGKTEPKIFVLQQLALFYGVSVPYLQGIEISDKDIVKGFNSCWLDKSNSFSEDSPHTQIDIYLTVYDIDERPVVKNEDDCTDENIKFWKKYFSFVFEKVKEEESKSHVFSYQPKKIKSIIINSIVDKLNYLNKSPLGKSFDLVKEELSKLNQNIEDAIRDKNKSYILKNIDEEILILKKFREKI